MAADVLGIALRTVLPEGVLHLESFPKQSEVN